MSNDLASALRLLALVPTAWACFVVGSAHAGPRFAAGMIPKPYFDFSTPPAREVAVRVTDMDTGATVVAPRDCTIVCVSGGRYSYLNNVAADTSGTQVFVWTFGWNDASQRTVYGVARIDATTAKVMELLPEPLPTRNLTTLAFSSEFVSLVRSFEDTRLGWYSSNPLVRSLDMGLQGGPSDAYGWPAVTSSDGKWLYTLAGGRLSRIDVATRTVVTSRAITTVGPIAFDAARQWLYALDYLESQLRVFDGISLANVTSHRFEGITDFLVAPGSHLLVSRQLPSTAPEVLVVDPATGTVASTLQLAGKRFVQDRHRNRFYRIGCELPSPACGSDALIEFDAGTFEETRRFPLDDRAPDDPSRATFRFLVEWLTLLPDPVTAVEFHHAAMDHYFLTADADEIDALDRGILAGWQRTGESFGVLRSDAGTSGVAVSVCRYYGRPERGLDSHFYSASKDECAGLQGAYDGAWVAERDDAFYVARADPASGACIAGTVPVYRLWNARFDSNHRYTTSATIKAEMIARGYVPEGDGPDRVAFCVRIGEP